ncbi:MAG: putative lipid II flippase FtsW [Nitrospinota bacterium]
MPIKRSPDYTIIIAALALLAIGLVMVYSSSAVLASEKLNDPYYFLRKQALWSLIGIVLMVIIMKIDYRRFYKFSYPIYFLILVLLILTLVPGIGRSVNGATRWIDLGFIAVQPAEFAKLGLLIFFSALLTKKINENKVTDFQFGLAPVLITLAPALVIIQLQPDMGSVISIAITTFFLLVISNARRFHLATIGIAFLSVALLSITRADYRRKRVLSFLDPWQDMHDSGYQIIQSYVALARGGLFGQGLGESKQKLFYLPEAHTDFIFSILGEELGFVGALIVIAIFLVIAWRGFNVGKNAPDTFGSLLAFGITFAITLQALVNISVATGIAPTKGLPLPFVSLGGSALIMWMSSLGLLLNISEHTIRKPISISISRLIPKVHTLLARGGR